MWFWEKSKAVAKGTLASESAERHPMSLLNAVRGCWSARKIAVGKGRTHFDKTAQRKGEEERREVKLVARLASQTQDVFEHEQVGGDGFGDDAVE